MERGHGGTYSPRREPTTPSDFKLRHYGIHADVTDVVTWLHRHAGGQILAGVSFDPAKCLHLSSVWVVQRGEGMKIDNGVAAAALRAIGYTLGAPRVERPGMIEGINRRGSAYERPP